MSQAILNTSPIASSAARLFNTSGEIAPYTDALNFVTTTASSISDAITDSKNQKKVYDDKKAKNELTKDDKIPQTPEESFFENQFLASEREALKNLENAKNLKDLFSATSITIGFDTYKQDNKWTKILGSTVTAGGDFGLYAGNDINIEGSQVRTVDLSADGGSSGGSGTLYAGNDINIESIAEMVRERGSKFGGSLTFQGSFIPKGGSANIGRNRRDSLWVDEEDIASVSTVGDLTVFSGGTTSLTGGVLYAGDQLTLDVAKLELEDLDIYDKSKDWSFRTSVGASNDAESNGSFTVGGHYNSSTKEGVVQATVGGEEGINAIERDSTREETAEKIANTNQDTDQTIVITKDKSFESGDINLNVTNLLNFKKNVETITNEFNKRKNSKEIIQLKNIILDEPGTLLQIHSQLSACGTSFSNSSGGGMAWLGFIIGTAHAEENVSCNIIVRYMKDGKSIKKTVELTKTDAETCNDILDKYFSLPDEYSKKNDTVITSEELDNFILLIAKHIKAVYDVDIQVTSGVRTPEEQAELMLKRINWAGGVSGLNIYKQKSLRDEIIESYKKGTTDEERMAYMAETITKQVKEGKYVSNHLRETALDIKSKGLDAKIQKKIFEDFGSYVDTKLFEYKGEDNEHFHLQGKEDFLGAISTKPGSGEDLDDLIFSFFPELYGYVHWSGRDSKEEDTNGDVDKDD